MTIELTPVSPTGLPATLRIAAEVLEHVRAELPALATLSERDQLLVATWLVGLRSERTRRSYLVDVSGWLRWVADRDLDACLARRVQVDLWVSQQLADGAEASSVRRRLSALSSFYRHLARHDLVDHQPTTGVERPRVDPNHTDTVGLALPEARALLAAAETAPGLQRLRNIAAIKLLLHNALRVDEMVSADVANLGYTKGHRVLKIRGKGNRYAHVVLAPPTWAALEEYLTDRAHQAGLQDWHQLDGPLLATAHDRRVHRTQLWELVQRLARHARIEGWDQLSIHSMRHTAITLALDAGVTLRDAQTYARHLDPRTIRRYDHSRENLDRAASYTVAAYLA